MCVLYNMLKNLLIKPRLVYAICRLAIMQAVVVDTYHVRVQALTWTLFSGSNTHGVSALKCNLYSKSQQIVWNRVRACVFMCLCVCVCLCIHITNAYLYKPGSVQSPGGQRTPKQTKFYLFK